MEADKRSLDVAIEETRIEMGYSTLKEKQIEAIAAFAQGKDTVVILPTGYGKSIIYSMIPFVFDKVKGLVLVLLFLLGTRLIKMAYDVL